MTHEEDVAAFAASMGWKKVESDKGLPTEEDMARWTVLSQQPQQESSKKKNLRGALCEYIDDMEVNELMEDLISILAKEEVYFRNRADIYAGLKESVEQLSEKLKDV